MRTRTINELRLGSLAVACVCLVGCGGNSAETLRQELAEIQLQVTKSGSSGDGEQSPGGEAFKELCTRYDDVCEELMDVCSSDGTCTSVDMDCKDEHSKACGSAPGGTPGGPRQPDPDVIDPEGPISLAGCAGVGRSCVEESEKDNVAQTTDFRENDVCYEATFSVCERQDNDQCEWTQNEQFVSCFEDFAK